MKTSHSEAHAVLRINPGDTLREAREQRGLSLVEVAAQLNLTVLVVSQLEAGQFDKLPGHTFARGYVRAYAKFLGLDQQELVGEFDRFTGTDAKGSDVHALGHIEEPARLSQRILRIVCFLLLVVLGLVGFFWWQAHNGQPRNAQAGAPIEHVEVEGADGTTEVHPLDEPEDQAAQQALQPPPASEPQAPAAAPPPAAAGPLPGVPPGATESAASSFPAAPAPAASSAPPDSPAAGTPLAAPGLGVLRVQYTADCWTQVSDASGKILVSAVKHGGEVLEVSGKPPLELRLGFVRAAQVSYNGQLVDLSASTRGQTARVKLGQ